MSHLINTKYDTLCNDKESDIYQHLPTLYRYAKECETIFETGVRGCVSSWAFIKGLLENGSSKKYILMNDLYECGIQELLDSVKGLDIQVEYVWKNNLTLDMSGNVDLTFIDTWHVYGQLKRELEKFSKTTNKYIILHDTTVDGIYGETLRNKTFHGTFRFYMADVINLFYNELQKGVPPNYAAHLAQEYFNEKHIGNMMKGIQEIHEESKSTGIPLEEIIGGLQKAVDEFLSSNPQWILHEKYENNYGLTILKRVSM
jgi:hypothetical protein